MNTAQITLANIDGLGIQDIQKLVSDGACTHEAAFGIVDGRIQRREKAGKRQLANVVTYRNVLASHINTAGGASVPAIPVPDYAAKQATPQANATLPSDPSALADAIVSAIGMQKIGQLISHLTARIANS